VGYLVTEPALHSLLRSLGYTAFYWPHAWTQDVLVTMGVAGLIVGLRRGGSAYIRHRILLWLLIWRGDFPADYLGYLEHAVGLVLLQRHGGIYEFVHRELRDYFADLAPAAEAARAAD
jgi:hypothetical protein